MKQVETSWNQVQTIPAGQWSLFLRFKELNPIQNVLQDMCGLKKGAILGMFKHVLNHSKPFFFMVLLGFAF